MSHITCHISHVTCHMSNDTGHMLNVTCHTSHMSYISRVLHSTSHVPIPGHHIYYTSLLTVRKGCWLILRTLPSVIVWAISSFCITTSFRRTLIAKILPVAFSRAKNTYKDWMTKEEWYTGRLRKAGTWSSKRYFYKEFM